MLSYFINETRRHERRLRNAQIPFEPFMCGEQKGIVFDESHLPSVLTTLRSTIERQDKSGYDGIEILHLKQNGRASATPTPPAMVTVEKWDGESTREQRDRFFKVAEEFATAFAVSEIVIISAHEGNTSIPPRIDTGKLNIFLWASATGKSHSSGENGITSAAKLWEFQIADAPGDWRIWYPSGQGTVIKDAAGITVAELVNNNLYIFYPIDNRKVSEGSNIFRQILEEVVLLRGETPKEIAKKRRELEKRFKAELEAEVKANPVVVKRWNGSDSLRDKFVAVATDFVQALGGTQIRIYDCCRNTDPHAPSTDGRVDICIWSSSDTVDNGGKMQATLFGAPLKWEDDKCVLKPSGETGFLVTDEDGSQVGKVMGDTIYIHYPLASGDAYLVWDGKGPEALFRRMLEEVVFLKTATAKQKAARAKAIALKYRARSREEYSRMCDRRFDKIIEKSRGIVAGNPIEVRKLQQSIIRLIRENKDAQNALKNMESCRAEAAGAYTREFDKLFEIPKVIDVRASDGVIKVFTDVLYCVDSRSGKRHEIGAFRIEISLDGGVRWINLTRKVVGYESGMNAPHVFADGHACLGNMEEVIPQLIADYEFTALVGVCIQFVENANVDDSAGRYINNWPLAAGKEEK